VPNSNSTARYSLRNSELTAAIASFILRRQVCAAVAIIV
jgi:hypothetical protein